MRNSVLVLGLVYNVFCVTVSDGTSSNTKGDSAIFQVGGLLREVSPYYLSVTLSSQIVRDGVIEELVSSTRFVTLSRGLSPAILRVGGSPANFLTYDPSSPSRSEHNAAKEHFEDWQSEFDDDGTDWENFTMTAEQYGDLKAFANSANMRILFDLNQFYRTPEVTWDPTNAMDIVKEADDSFLWQLGNEPNSYYHNYKYNFTGTMDAADFLLLTEEMKKYHENAIIVGPDVTNPRFPLMTSENEKENVEGIHMKFLQEFLQNLEVELSAITWHQYYLPGTNVTVEDFTSLETLDMLTWQIPQAVDLRDEYCPDTPLWLTETSSSFGGGAQDLSNAYVAGFLWLDKLGLAAVMGIELLARQTLFQKRYALIDPEYDPYPDYWLSLAFKQLVGEKVLELVVGASPKTTRLYAHCQKENSASYEPGNVIIYGVNVDFSTPVTVKLEGMPSEHSIEQYLLQPPDGNLQSKEVMLNDQLLQMTSDEELPELLPLALPQQEFEIPPVSFGFWVILKANVLDCM